MALIGRSVFVSAQKLSPFNKESPHQKKKANTTGAGVAAVAQ